MSKPFKGTINIDIKDSVPDWEPYAQPVPPDGRAERALRRPRRRRLLGDGVVRRADRDAEHQADRRPRPALHELPHDGALLADALLPADGPQPHDELDGVHHRGGVGVPERERPHPGRVRDDPGGPRRARLEHLHRRQVAPLPRGRDEQWPRRRRTGRSGAASSASTASSAPRRTSGIPTSPTTTTPSSSRSCRRRATTSRSTSPTRRCRSSRTPRWSRRTSRSSSTTPSAPPTRRTTCRRSGPTSTRASSTWATRPTASSCSRTRRSSGSSPSTPSSRRSTRTPT